MKNVRKIGILGKLVSTEAVLSFLLIAIAIAAPLLSYAGVSLIFPDSTITSDVMTPSITWAQGADYSAAATLGYAGSFALANSDSSFTVTVSGLSGGTVTIDKLVNCIADSGVTTFKLKISIALAGTLTDPTTLKFRFWTGATAPTSDVSAGVVAVLDLESVLDTETADAIAGDQTVFVQMVCELPTDSSGSSTVSIQPSSIT